MVDFRCSRCRYPYTLGEVSCSNCGCGIPRVTKGRCTTCGQLSRLKPPMSCTNQTHAKLFDARQRRSAEHRATKRAYRVLRQMHEGGSA